MKITTILAGLVLGGLSVEAQYKAIVATPTAPIVTATGRGDVYVGLELRTVGGGYAWGQYNGAAVKISLADGSITPVENNAPPSPGDFSSALGLDGTQPAGYTGGTKRVCARWDGNGVATTFSAAGWQQATCTAISGGIVAGYVENDTVSGGTTTPSAQHAGLWTGPTSFTDLHTGGNNFSQVLGMVGNQQVGFQSPSVVQGFMGTRNFDYMYPEGASQASAYLWKGSTSGAVNLNPAGFTSSVAFATNGVQQGGFAYTTSFCANCVPQTTPVRHAMLWSGTAASAVDLNPPGWWDTQVRALSLSAQAGDGYEPQFPQIPNNGMRHALLWTGSATSMVDLNPYLPLGFIYAVANGIDSSGNVVGHAWRQTPTGYVFAPVIFQPQPASLSQLASVTLNASEVNQGDTLQGQVTLAGPAPSGGQVITFLACASDGLDYHDLAPVPASAIVPEGQTTATFSFTTNNRFLVPSFITVIPRNYGGQDGIRIYGNDGTVSRFASVKVDMVPFLRTFNIPTPLAGGASATGTLLLSGTPWPSGDAVVTLTSGNPAVLTVPATATVFQGANVPNASFSVTTVPVTVQTVVPVTASINGSTMTINVTVQPAPPVSLTGISVTQEVVGGNPYAGMLTFSGPVPFGGATVALTSDNPAIVPVPASVSAAQGQTTITFSGVTATVAAAVTANITATYSGVTLTAPITVSNEPPLTITVAEYDTISHVVKVEATTKIPNSTLSFAIDSNGLVGTMTLSNGVWSGSLKNVATAPALITVSNSNGGSVSVPPTLRAK
ncbi:MAG TPA: hypothetical protein VKU01_31630 [Bryobacteraceae bacterium]|nr:hypothetical protein [Bryobacteraceae bacterium]